MDLASGAAGLISLAALAVQSASTLYTFCRKVPRVAGEVEAIISEIRALSQTLESIQQIASDREAQKFSASTSRMIAKLQEGVARCTADLEAWNTGMAALKMEDGKWAKNAVKKLKLAADAGRFSETRLKISAHRDQLGLLLEILTV
jgi:predicted  nucleic acid-binding Zn-ribbon protein